MFKIADKSCFFFNLSAKYRLLPLDCVEGVGGDARHDGDGPAQEEGGDPVCVGAQHRRLECVVQPEVEAAVDEDAGAGDPEAAVQPPE